MENQGSQPVWPRRKHRTLLNYGSKFLSWREPSGKESWASALPDSDFGGSLVWGPLHRKLAKSRNGALSSVLTCWVSFPQHSHAFIPSPWVQDEQHRPPPTRRWVSKSSFEVCWRYLRSWPFSLPVPLPRGRGDNLQRRKFLVSSCVYSFTEVERNMKDEGLLFYFCDPINKLWAASQEGWGTSQFHQQCMMLLPRVILML